MSDVQGNDPIPSYRDEFKHSIELFEKSLQAHGQSNMENQKAAFRNVMAEASHIMSETAPQVLSPTDQKQVAKLQEDFKTFSQNPSSEMMKKLQSDLNSLKNIA